MGDPEACSPGNILKLRSLKMRLPAFWKAMLDNDDSGLSRLETRQGILRVCEFYRVPKIAATIVQFIENTV